MVLLNAALQHDAPFRQGRDMRGSAGSVWDTPYIITA
jgi:hypothetical protein